MKTVMHKNAMDVAFRIENVLTSDNGNKTWIGTWISLGACGEPWDLDFGTITLNPEQELNWIDISDKLNIKRSKPGVPE